MHSRPPERQVCNCCAVCNCCCNCCLEESSYTLRARSFFNAPSEVACVTAVTAFQCIHTLKCDLVRARSFLPADLLKPTRTDRGDRPETPRARGGNLRVVCIEKRCYSSYSSYNSGRWP